MPEPFQTQLQVTSSWPALVTAAAANSGQLRDPQPAEAAGLPAAILQADITVDKCLMTHVERPWMTLPSLLKVMVKTCSKSQCPSTVKFNWLSWVRSCLHLLLPALPHTLQGLGVRRHTRPPAQSSWGPFLWNSLACTVTPVAQSEHDTIFPQCALWLNRGHQQSQVAGPRLWVLPATLFPGSAQGEVMGPPDPSVALPVQPSWLLTTMRLWELGLAKAPWGPNCANCAPPQL